MLQPSTNTPGDGGKSLVQNFSFYERDHLVYRFPGQHDGTFTWNAVDVKGSINGEFTTAIYASNQVIDTSGHSSNFPKGKYLVISSNAIAVSIPNWSGLSTVEGTSWDDYYTNSGFTTKASVEIYVKNPPSGFSKEHWSPHGVNGITHISVSTGYSASVDGSGKLTLKYDSTKTTSKDVTDFGVTDHTSGYQLKWTYQLNEFFSDRKGFAQGIGSGPFKPLASGTLTMPFDSLLFFPDTFNGKVQFDIKISHDLSYYYLRRDTSDRVFPYNKWDWDRPYDSGVQTFEIDFSKVKFS